MSHQPNLFSPEPDDPSAALRQGARSLERTPMRRQMSPWLQRIELLVRVIVRLYLGLLIIALPWMRFWTENGLLTYTPVTAWLATSGFVRGMVSGLGLLNVIMAFRELFFPNRRQ